MKIVKILNNNAVVCEGSDKYEQIVMGRGIAFQKKVGTPVDESRIEKTFILKNEKTNNRFKKFIQDIPLEHILLSEKIITHAKQYSSKKFEESIYITLTDHLNGALERHKKNITVKNPLTSAIKSFYPEEFQLAQDAVDIIKKETGVAFSIDEVAFITVHFVTAELGVDTPEFNCVLTFVQNVSAVVKNNFKVEIDETSSSWQRFLTHLSFFAQRYLSGKENPDKKALLYDSVSQAFPKAAVCVEKIADYIKETYSQPIGDEEKTYLIIHVNRLQQEFPAEEKIKLYSKEIIK